MESLDDSLISNYKKRNRKLFVFYKTLAHDLLFYYTISYLFLVDIKGLSAAQIVFAESFYPIFEVILQIPCTALIKKFGKKKSLLIGNLGIAIYLFMVLALNNILELIIANFFCAIGFVIKGLSESTLLYDSLEDNKDKKESFSKIEGKASSCFFFVDAITSFLTGFLYAINPYFPISFSLIAICIALVINIFLYDIPVKHSSNETNKKNISSSQLKDILQGFKYIFNSNRLRALILFNALFASLVTLMVTLHRSILDDVNVSSEYLGIIFALMGIVVSFSSTRSVDLHKKYRNKTLSFLGIILTISIAITGLSPLINLPKFMMYYILLITISLVYIVKGPFYILIKQYLNSFCDSNMRLKIYSANQIIEYTSKATLSIICSFMLSCFSSAVTTLIIGLCSFILMLFLISYMSTRVGLKPEQYSEKDIFFLELE